MGTENIWLIALAGFGAFIANVMYAMGGTAGFGLWWRRFLGSFVLALDANLVALYVGNWHWQYLTFFPCLAIGFSLGYGSDTILGKIIKRTIFAIGVLSVCWFGLWAIGFTVYGWVVLGLAFITGLTSVALGVINPFNSAPLEQFLICQVLCMYVPFWAFVR